MKQVNKNRIINSVLLVLALILFFALITDYSKSNVSAETVYSDVVIKTEVYPITYTMDSAGNVLGDKYVISGVYFSIPLEYEYDGVKKVSAEYQKHLIDNIIISNNRNIADNPLNYFFLKNLCPSEPIGVVEYSAVYKVNGDKSRPNDLGIAFRDSINARGFKYIPKAGLHDFPNLDYQHAIGIYSSNLNEKVDSLELLNYLNSHGWNGSNIIAENKTVKDYIFDNSEYNLKNYLDSTSAWQRFLKQGFNQTLPNDSSITFKAFNKIEKIEDIDLLPGNARSKANLKEFYNIKKSDNSVYVLYFDVDKAHVYSNTKFTGFELVKNPKYGINEACDKLENSYFYKTPAYKDFKFLEFTFVKKIENPENPSNPSEDEIVHPIDQENGPQDIVPDISGQKDPKNIIGNVFEDWKNRINKALKGAITKLKDLFEKNKKILKYVFYAILGVLGLFVLVFIFKILQPIIYLFSLPFKAMSKKIDKAEKVQPYKSRKIKTRDRK